MVGKVAETFSQQTNGLAVSVCGALKMALQVTVSIAADLAIPAVGDVVGSVYGAGRKLTSATIKALDEASTPALGDVIGSVASAGTPATIKTRDEAPWPQRVVQQGLPMVWSYTSDPLGAAYTKGICAAFDGEFEADNYQTHVDIDLQMGHMETELRRTKGELGMKLAIGDFDESHPEEGSALAKMIGYMWAAELPIKETIHDPSILERYVGALSTDIHI